MNENRNDKLEYDVQKRAKAGTAATFRAVVAVYIIYLGYNILRSTIDGSSTLPPWVGWTVGIFFIAAALGFGYYIWRRWHRDVEAARLPEAPEPQEIEEEDDAPD